MKLPLVLALSAAIGGAAWAQPNEAPAPFTQREPRLKTYQLRVKNVRASVIAWWIDPANHPRPFGGPVPLLPAVLAKFKTGASALPEGAERVVAVDPQNVLLAFCTEQGFRQLEPLIASLDRSLRRIELSARFVHLAPTDIALLGAEVKPVSAEGKVDFGRVRGDNLNATLVTLQAQRKVRLSSAPPLTVIDHSLSFIGGVFNTGTVGVQDAQGVFRPLFQDGVTLKADNAAPEPETNDLLQVTPSINTDGSVTMMIVPGYSAQVLATGETLSLSSGRAVRAVVNVGDGETIALTLPLNSKAPNKATVVLLTPRVVQPASEPTARTNNTIVQ